MPRPKVVIAGGGFAAWCLARAVDRELERTDSFEATIVCPAACAALSPWTHEVLAGRLHPEQAVVPWRDALRHVRVVLGRATHVLSDTRALGIDGPGVQTGCDPDSLAYDDLVLATGIGAGPGGATERSLPLRSPSHAIALRNRLLEALAAASGEDSARRRKALLSVAVVGSDARAVAAAVEILGLLRQSATFFPRIQADDPRVMLVSPGGPCTSWGQRAAVMLTAHLAAHGVEVRSGCRITEEGDDYLVLSHEGGEQERVEIRTVVSIDTASHGSALIGMQGAPMQGGRVQVDELLRVPGMQGVHALGECGRHPNEQPTPAVIVRQADWLARAIARRARGQAAVALPTPPVVDAVSVGGGAGLARVGKRITSGMAAGWMARAIVRRVVPGIGRRMSLAAWSLLEPLGVRQLVSRSGAPGTARPLYLTPPPPPMR